MCSVGGKHLTGNQDGLTSRLSEGKLAFPYLCFHAIRRDKPLFCGGVAGRGRLDRKVSASLLAGSVFTASCSACNF